MKLGEQLKQLQGMDAQQQKRVSLEEAAKRDEEVLKALLEVRFFFDYAFRLFEHRILNGKLPGTVALGGKTFRTAAMCLSTHSWSIPMGKDVDWLTQGRGIWSKTHRYHELWLEFARLCQAAGLKPQWIYCHDGVGVESWYELGVEVL